VVNPTNDIAAPFLTNEVKESEEKWLVEKVEKLFADAESGAIPTQNQVDGIAIVLGALRVLGLEAAAQSFVARLKTLETHLSK
jgi:hypothetical protein